MKLRSLHRAYIRTFILTGVVYIGYQNSWTCNWGMQIDWWLQPRAVFGHTFSGIIWQKWSQFNCMTIVMASLWDRASLMYITFGITLIYYIVSCVVDSASQFFATLYMMKTGVVYGQRSSQERLPENRNSIPKLRSLPPIAGVFQASFCPSTRLRSHIWDTAEIPKSPSPPMYPLHVLGHSRGLPRARPDRSLSNDNDIELIYSNWYAACRSFQSSCSKAELCCTEVCWCESDRKCVKLIFPLLPPMLRILNYWIELKQTFKDANL